MADAYDGFSKKHDFLVCIDSDGCAIDSMDIKHIKCFGPCMVNEWQLEDNAEKILSRWNDINLYTMTRGINRFKGLAMALREINDTIKPIEDIAILENWVETADELSNAAVEKAANERGSISLKKALSWSMAVNKAIKALPASDVKPFENVLENIKEIHKTCDVAIVSSANYEAVKEEWTRFGLLEHVDVLLAQNAGSKKSCIEKLLTYGYEKNKVMMTGDAPGDMEAAQKNNVFYYPILVRHEKESWKKISEAVKNLKEGKFEGAFQQKLIDEFKKNLS